MKAIIFNSGIGSRMMELTKDNPKSLVKLYNGETILERQIRILYECGIEEIIITVGYLKNQIIETCKKFENIKFKFVENKDYDKTNYIVSLYNSLDYLNEDMLILHGDLVFNEELVEKVILNNEKSLFVYSEKKKLPEKDFKARIQNGLLKEISINIFDNDCYPLQPFYKLDKINVKKWGNKVKEYVNKGIVNCYAENALNEILPDMEIRGMSYDNDYIEEIDNQEDYYRVSNEIKKYDFKNQDIIFTENISKDLERYLKNFILKMYLLFQPKV